MLKSTVSLAALGLAEWPLSTFGLSSPEAGAKLIPFLDVQPIGKMLQWELLTNWVTPTDQVFAVSHYGVPEVSLEKWQLDISGLVRRPRSFSLETLKKYKRRSVTATLECSGNGSNPGFMGAIGNVTWTGTPLAPLLKEAGPHHRAIEAVFFGADEKTEKIRDKEYTQNFARSLSLADVLKSGDILLAYEMNGQPLEKSHGGPVRLIVPGWFGIAWVKWLSRIELLDRRFMSKFMARDYVTIRGEERDDKTIWRETSVGPIDVKSIVARALRLRDGSVRFQGAAWTDGTPLDSVEVKIDDGPWRPATLDTSHGAKYAWSFFRIDWTSPAAGEHTVVARARDADGRVQPAADSAEIKLKRTYWEANQQWPRRIKL